VRPARALALAALAVALAGCGSAKGGAGSATLWVTRDRGSVVLHAEQVPSGESALQALDRAASVKTRYGGRYVRAVDGLAEQGRRAWFYYVNGYLADRSAADYRLRPGDVAWWDYRAWRDPLQDPLAVGAFPQPFLNGYGGRRHRTVIVSPDARRVRTLARRLHATVVGRGAGTLARDVNVISIEDAGPTSATLSYVSSTAPGSPVRLSFSGDPNMLLRARPFRYRYQVGG
jgi:uncharacterized protein DUF4430